MVKEQHAGARRSAKRPGGVRSEQAHKKARQLHLPFTPTIIPVSTSSVTASALIMMNVCARADLMETEGNLSQPPASWQVKLEGATDLLCLLHMPPARGTPPLRTHAGTPPPPTPSAIEAL
jgi:hypothetical protein